MLDCALSNNVAMHVVKIVYPLVFDIGCFSHTVDRVGEKFKVPHLHEFITYWISLFSHSYKARPLWKEQTGQAFCGYSTTRWWSKWEVQNQILNLFGDLKPFLEGEEYFSPATRSKLLEFVTDSVKENFLRIELAAVVDAGCPFVEATYKLEGDGLLAFECYEIISALTNAVSLAHYPYLVVVTSQIASNNSAAKQQLMAYGTSCTTSSRVLY